MRRSAGRGRIGSRREAPTRGDDGVVVFETRDPCAKLPFSRPNIPESAEIIRIRDGTSVEDVRYRGSSGTILVASAPFSRCHSLLWRARSNISRILLDPRDYYYLFGRSVIGAMWGSSILCTPSGCSFLRGSAETVSSRVPRVRVRTPSATCGEEVSG